MRGRRVLIALALIGGAGYGLSRFFRAELFRASIHRGLEASLGRKVEIKGAISYSLIPRPGFAIENVYIHEHPSVGVEPFAWVSELTFHVSLPGLLSGRVDLAGIRMDEPHINLMKHPGSPWNFQPFLDHALVSKTSGATLPAIEITNGRLNFKSGDTKSVLYLDATDLTVEAESSSPDRFGIKFEGEPARTDRSARALGRLSGRGMLQLGRTSGAESTIELSLTSERAAISEIMTMIEGRSIGLGGFVTSRLRLSGPLSAIGIEGKLELDDVGRFSSLLPGGAGWGLQLRGKLDLPGQELRLETAAPANQLMPLSFRVRATQLLSQPSWAMLLTANRVPLASLRSLLAETGVSIPADVPSEGNVSGAVGLTRSGGVQGTIVAREGSLPVEGSQAIRFAEASVAVSGREFRLNPMVVELGEGGKQVAVEARYNAESGDREARLQTAPIPLADLKPLWRVLSGGPMPAILERAERGTVQGSIQSRQLGDEPPRWTADFAASDLSVAFDELPGPLRAASALISIRGDAMAIRKLDAKVGNLGVAGSVDHDPLAKVPLRFRLTAAEAAIGDLEPFVSIAFPKRQGLIDRTLRRSAPVPAWLKGRKAEGELRIGKLMIGEYRLDNSVARVDWTGAKLEVRDWKAAAGEGEFFGSVSADLSVAEPSYKARFDVKNMKWQDGRLDSPVTAETSGFGLETLARLRLSGTFRALDVTIAPGTEWRSASGSYTWTGSAASRLQVRGMEVASGADTYQGQANSGAEGRLVIELTNAQKQLRLAGRMSGLRIELQPQ